MSRVLIPERMQALARDSRGYPIPWGVLIDEAGLAHFSVNDERKRDAMIRRDLCSVCGTELFRGRWFVGGAMSAFHPHGAFIDPPMHSECAHYALLACPYIAAPRYAGEVGRKKLAAHREALPAMMLLDRTMIPGRPTDDVFVAIMTVGQRVLDNTNLVPKRPYRRVEFWRHGVQISSDEGEATIRKALAQAPEL